jgi:hypothetical protein
VALRRVQTSPLAVERRSEPRRPQAVRLVPLVAGLGELAFFAVNGRPGSVGGQLAGYLSGVLLTMVGLVVAGPWLTMHGSRLLARRARRPVGLIAGRRLADDPQAGFRAVSGLVLALFVGSAAIGTIASVLAAATPPGGGHALVQDLARPALDEPLPDVVVPQRTLDALTAIDGVDGVSVVHGGSTSGAVVHAIDAKFYVTCAQLAHTPVLGRCPAGADTVKVRPHFTGAVVEGAPHLDEVTWPATPLSAAQVEQLPVTTIVVDNDGTTAAIEQARTVLETTGPATSSAPETIGEMNRHSTRDLLQYQQLADVVIGANLAIAGASLAVSVVAGLNDRRRPFSLLRLAGTPLKMLRRVVAVEAIVPLLATAAVAAGVGFLTAALFIRAQMDRPLTPPGPTYYLVVAAGLAASLAVIASTLPLLERVTGPEAARND